VENRLNLIARKMPPESGPVREGRTSGSTGAPFKFKRSAMMEVAATAMTERMMGWWSVDGGKSHAVVANDSTKKARPPEGLTTEGWHSKHPNGLRHFLAAATDVDAVLQWLLLRQPRYLSSYPPVLKELALNARQRSLALKFDLVFGFATVLDIETRDLVRSAFGAEIAETYGSEEAGHLAAQCPDCGELHVSAESVIVEILRPDGSPASDGEFGRERRQVSRSELIGIIRPRVEEILEEVRARLDAAGFEYLPGQRIVLTGGGSLLPGLDSLASKILGRQTRIGRPLRIHGLPQAMTGAAFASAVGMALHASHPQDECWDFEVPADRKGALRVRRAMRWFRDNW
jgi:hypothetical protein